jgi:hypothetical protein
LLFIFALLIPLFLVSCFLVSFFVSSVPIFFPLRSCSRSCSFRNSSTSARSRACSSYSAR